ncbi:MAG: hypothetical protein PHX78_05960 [bacterium]|nr:hypothetical protein [bacterium]
MKKNMIKLIVVALLISPMLSSCNTKKLEEEIASLKQEVATLTSEKSAAEAQVKELTIKCEEATKANDDLKAELEKAKAPKAKAPAAPAKKHKK